MAAGVNVVPGQRGEEALDGQEHRCCYVKEIKVKTGGESLLLKKKIQYREIDVNLYGLIQLHVYQHDHKQDHRQNNSQHPVDFKIADEGKRKKDQDVDNGHQTAEVSQPADDKVNNAETGGWSGSVIKIAESDGHGQKNVQEQKPVSPAYGAGNFVLVSKKTGNFQVIH